MKNSFLKRVNNGLHEVTVTEYALLAALVGVAGIGIYQTTHADHQGQCKLPNGVTVSDVTPPRTLGTEDSHSTYSSATISHNGFKTLYESYRAQFSQTKDEDLGADFSKLGKLVCDGKVAFDMTPAVKAGFGNMVLVSDGQDSVSLYVYDKNYEIVAGTTIKGGLSEDTLDKAQRQIAKNIALDDDLTPKGREIVASQVARAVDDTKRALAANANKSTFLSRLGL